VLTEKGSGASVQRKGGLLSRFGKMDQRGRGEQQKEIASKRPLYPLSEKKLSNRKGGRENT